MVRVCGPGVRLAVQPPLLAVLLVSSSVAAEPYAAPPPYAPPPAPVVESQFRGAIGASAGTWHNEQDADAGVHASGTLGLWGRFSLSKRIAVQAEIARHKADGNCGEFCTFDAPVIRTYGAMLAVDLRDRGQWMPMLLVGAGLDREDGGFGMKGSHLEGGVGLEYRAEGGFLIGADVRLGGRSIDNGDMILPAVVGGMREGEYRAARITMGIRL